MRYEKAKYDVDEGLTKRIVTLNDNPEAEEEEEQEEQDEELGKEVT